MVTGGRSPPKVITSLQWLLAGGRSPPLVISSLQWLLEGGQSPPLVIFFFTEMAPSRRAKPANWALPTVFQYGQPILPLCIIRCARLFPRFQHKWHTALFAHDLALFPSLSSPQRRKQLVWGAPTSLARAVLALFPRRAVGGPPQNFFRNFLVGGPHAEGMAHLLLSHIFIPRIIIIIVLLATQNFGT